MRLLGLEPKTYGLKVRSDSDASSDSETSCDDEPDVLAFCLAFMAQSRPDLAAVAEAWPKLPEPIKTVIVAIVHAAKGVRP